MALHGRLFRRANYGATRPTRRSTFDRGVRAVSDAGMSAPPPEILLPLPRDGDGPVFREPWEAQSFAMALALYERGIFTWPEWAAMLADEIKRAQAAGDPDAGEHVLSPLAERARAHGCRERADRRGRASTLSRRLGPARLTVRRMARRSCWVPRTSHRDAVLAQAPRNDRFGSYRPATATRRSSATSAACRLSA